MRIEILVKILPRRLGNVIVLGPVAIYRVGWRSPSLQDWARGQLLAIGW